MENELLAENREWRSMAEKATRAAGDLLRQRWNTARQVRHKGYRDYVTESDLEAQRVITDLIRASYPDHGFLAEEDDSSLPHEGKALWIIDPIDGTSNYSRSLPNFCISVAAARRSNGGIPDRRPATLSAYQIMAAAVFDPMRDEMFSAARGAGATRNGEALQVSSTADLAEAIVGLDWSRQRAKRQAMLEALARFAHHVHTVRALGSAVLALAWTAAGRMDIYCNFGIGAWDVAAGALLIEEAGGSAANLMSQRWQLGDVGCIASNGKLDQVFMETASLHGKHR